MIGELTRALIAGGYLKESESGNPLIVGLRLSAVPAVKLSLHLKIAPNAITFLSLFVGCLASYWYWREAIWAYVIAWTVSVVLDYADGVVARKSGKVSRFGYIFDLLGDRIKLVLLVVVWGILTGTAVSIAIIAVILILLVLTELIAHLLIQHQPSHPNPQDTLSALRLMFFSFDMHSFLIYGLGISFGGSLAYAANVWLAFLLGLNFYRECRCRMIDGSKVVIRLNQRYFGWRK